MPQVTLPLCMRARQAAIAIARIPLLHGHTPLRPTASHKLGCDADYGANPRLRLWLDNQRRGVQRERRILLLERLLPLSSAGGELASLL